MSTPRIGLIGAGAMGHGIGKNLIEKGFSLSVLAHRNRAPVEDLLARGGVEAADVADLATRSDIVILCVTGSPQVEDLFRRDGGLLQTARRGTIVIDTSTSRPASSLALAEALRAGGSEFVDAPLTRSPAEAETGRLNTMVGASQDLFDQLQPVFEAYCENIFHAGETGSGHRLKLINNFLITGTLALFAEAVIAAGKTDVNAETLHQLLNAGALSSPFLNNLLPNVAAGRFDTMQFTIANALKDLSYYNDLMEGAALANPIGVMTQQVFTQAQALGFGEHFIPSLIEAQAKLHGIDLAHK